VGHAVRLQQQDEGVKASIAVSRGQNPHPSRTDG
jgi:hypothetical protein